ncbi:MAG: helix-turn-helix domain-containing protein [Caldimonas sp.]
MSEPVPESAVPQRPTAGRLLREARQAQGLHIAALASSIKVVPRKLELLESDRLDELPDATFTRALAQTVCRSLKIDAAPILALLPPPSGYRLEHVGEGLNTPFREHSERLAANDWSTLARPAVWLPALLLVAAAVVYLMPPGWLPNSAARSSTGTDETPANAGPGASGIATAPGGVASASGVAGIEAVDAAGAASASLAAGAATEPAVAVALPAAALVAESTPASSAAALRAASAAAASTPKLLQLRASADTWIGVVDARGQTLLSRTIKPGETVDLDGVVPLKVRIGNVSGTEIVFRGQAVSLAPYARDNLAWLELK